MRKVLFWRETQKIISLFKFNKDPLSETVEKLKSLDAFCIESDELRIHIIESFNDVCSQIGNIYEDNYEYEEKHCSF